MSKLRIYTDFTVLDRMLGRLRENETPVRIVHDGVEYGIYQEFGARGRAPRPAAQTAARDVEPAYRAVMEKITQVEDPDAAIEKVARNLEAAWKRHIIEMRIIDTGAYLRSIAVSKPEEWGGEG